MADSNDNTEHLDLIDEETDNSPEASLPMWLSKNFDSAKNLVDRYTHCAFCGSNLHFTYLTDFSTNMTQETSKCPECGTRVRRTLYKLQ